MAFVWATLAVFTLLSLYLGDSVLHLLGDQLDKRRAYKLGLERERTRRAKIEQDREALIWRELERE